MILSFMTMVIGLNSKETIWLLTDRRLTGNGVVARDDAVKAMVLETRQNDIALLGYAGLGATLNHNEPSEWMSSVLCGRNLTLTEYLNVLAQATKKQLPKHLKNFNWIVPQHNLVIPSLVENRAKLYTIDIALTQNKQSVDFRFSDYNNGQNKSKNPVPPRVCLAGSGALYLNSNRKWLRPLLSLANKSDEGKIHPKVVANRMAELNYEVYKNLPDKSVGPKSIVIWRNRRKGRYKGGGAHEFYNGSTAEHSNLPIIPMIDAGMDMRAISEIMLSHTFELFKENKGFDQDSFTKRINEEMKKIRQTPSEELT